MSKKVPLLDEVLKYKKENNLILSMPGNKSGIGFLRDDVGREFVNNMGFLDITEVDPLDNLHAPEGIIKEAQELLAKTYDVRKAYFVVNGSTAGNLASIFDAFNEDDEILVERNCHKSVYNGIILRKLKVKYIEPVVYEDKGLFLPPTEKEIYKAINKCKNAKGIILTYPNYFGIGYDIVETLKDLKDRGLKIIIDGAHGAHYGITEKLPKSIVKYADYIVLSAHKTLPSLTQGSYLLINNDTNVDFYLKAFMTTSPSYLIMSSLDYARYYLENYGKEDYDKLIDLAIKWSIKINNLNKVRVLSKEDLPRGYDLDLSRYILILKKGYSGHKLLNYLRSLNIQCEMSFSGGVVLILSPFNLEKDFEKIYNSLKSLNLELLVDTDYQNYCGLIPKKVLELYEAFNMEFEYVNIYESESKISKEAIIPYPPGIPLICAGEVISKEAIDIINGYIKNNKTVIGLKNGLVKVIKDIK
ncbi:aminotransferase class I/II-fold pyridoxal phosphate-dependent enzyme [Clostridium sp.]|uniref:aminotransferase class I/II-fold pyridoxal phosphate-dependent enzyme n=1 Tax=Clostridium sp. TaxID=1506 RepID=UPI0025C5C2B1|nr:aminotransferase class I/II-fold pyridoxal phosphate-dependent enzyme [Clostridium sp.]MCI9304556.1 aminotransferase class I/II-fold pyridoxal phosphate-dependent enzyme [Clostridium sp.]